MRIYTGCEKATVNIQKKSMCKQGLLATGFFERTVSGANDLVFLQELLISNLAIKFPYSEEAVTFGFNNMLRILVLQNVSENFLEWPARSKT